MHSSFEKKNPATPPGITATHAVNKKQLAETMGISLSTLKRLLKSYNLDIRRGVISPLKQVEIFQTLGWMEKRSNEP